MLRSFKNARDELSVIKALHRFRTEGSPESEFDPRVADSDFQDGSVDGNH